MTSSSFKPRRAFHIGLATLSNGNDQPTNTYKKKEEHGHDDKKSYRNLNDEIILKRPNGKRIVRLLREMQLTGVDDVVGNLRAIQCLAVIAIASAIAICSAATSG